MQKSDFNGQFCACTCLHLQFVACLLFVSVSFSLVSSLIIVSVCPSHSLITSLCLLLKKMKVVCRSDCSSTVAFVIRSHSRIIFVYFPLHFAMWLGDLIDPTSDGDESRRSPYVEAFFYRVAMCESESDSLTDEWWVVSMWVTVSALILLDERQESLANLKIASPSLSSVFSLPHSLSSLVYFYTFLSTHALVQGSDQKIFEIRYFH